MRPLAQSEAAMTITAPLLVGVVMGVLWEIACRELDVPVFLFPKPTDIGRKLASEWPSLLRALGMTLRIALQAFASAVVIGTLIAFVFVQSRAIETQLLSLCSSAAGDADRGDCAADHHPGKKHAGRAHALRDRRGVVPDHLQHHAWAAQRRPGPGQPIPDEPGGRLQTLWRLRIPSALPYFFGGLRISSGLALIGAVVAEFVAGTGGRSSGLAYEILQAGFAARHPAHVRRPVADHACRRRTVHR